MNKVIVIVAIIAIVILLILPILVNVNLINGQNNNQSNKCEDVVYDPITLQKIPIFSEKGNKLFNYKLIYYLRNYLKNTKKDWNYILPTEFNKIKNNNYNNDNNMFILDVRHPKDYQKGHIKGSLNIFWLDLLEDDNLAKLPKDKEIILICYVGHTASQMLVLLKLLGYKVKVLKFGMGISPSKDVPVAGWTNYGYDIVK